MKWFKHDTMASHDAKIKRLRLRHGLEGVGMYWSLLESIARSVEPHNLLFELEEDSELISIEFGMSHEKVEMMMNTMIELDLFQLNQGRITCVKLRERTDDYTQKLLRNSNGVRTNSGESADSVGRKSALLEENRKEKNITSQGDYDSEFDSWWARYPKKTGKGKAKIRFNNLSKSDREALLADDLDRRYGHRAKQYIKGGDVYISERRWEDEFDEVTEAPKYEGVVKW